MAGGDRALDLRLRGDDEDLHTPHRIAVRDPTPPPGWSVFPLPFLFYGREGVRGRGHSGRKRQAVPTSPCHPTRIKVVISAKAEIHQPYSWNPAVPHHGSPAFAEDDGGSLLLIDHHR
jgi:hypothetical protein